jgi:hypothetical protein
MNRERGNDENRTKDKNRNGNKKKNNDENSDSDEKENKADSSSQTVCRLFTPSSECSCLGRLDVI